MVVGASTRPSQGRPSAYTRPSTSYGAAGRDAAPRQAGRTGAPSSARPRPGSQWSGAGSRRQQEEPPAEEEPLAEEEQAAEDEPAADQFGEETYEGEAFGEVAEDEVPPEDEFAPEEGVPEEEYTGYGSGEEAAEQPAEEEYQEEGSGAAAFAEEEEDEDVPRREDDLALEEVPEDMRESVEGNLTLKRLLSTDSQPVDGGAAKKRRLNGGEAQVQRVLDGVKAAVLARWKLNNDLAARYVVEAAELEDVEAVQKSGWQPSRYDGRDGQKSCAEQVAERLNRARESKCPAGGSVDVIAAFKHRWQLTAEDDRQLRELCHKDLRYVVTNFDGSRTIEELTDEAGMTMPDEDKATEAAPDKKGLLTMSRFNRLELIDPSADALVVGDANLTFSLILAAHREGLGHVGRIVATTFEQIDTLRERYKEIDETVKTLEEKSAEVLHNVDCTRLAVDPRFQGMTGKFGAVYYNFPHAGVVKGFFDGHPFVRWRHENLMSLFFRALRGFVKPGGVVKVSSNSNATGVRYSDILMAASLSEFVHVETVPFLEWQLRSYRRSYGDRRDSNRRPEEGEIYKSQRAHSDMVYSFAYAPSGDTPPKPRIRHPPTRHELLHSNEGRFKNLSPANKKRNVEDMLQLFLSYVQGIHIG